MVIIVDDADQSTGWGLGCSSISAWVWWTATSPSSMARVRQKVTLIKHLSSGRWPGSTGISVNWYGDLSKQLSSFLNTGGFIQQVISARSQGVNGGGAKVLIASDKITAGPITE